MISVIDFNSEFKFISNKNWGMFQELGQDMLKDSIILQEEIDPNYEPTQEGNFL